MTIYGFSAARKDYDGDRIREALKEAGSDEHTYVTGGAAGGDSVIGHWLAENFPAAKHVVLLPTRLPTQKDQFDSWWDRLTTGIKVHVVDPNLLTSTRDRNRNIVSRAEVLYAFPAYKEDHSKSLRSGTWQTIRMARRKGIPIHISVQNSFDSWVEGE